jgi:uncharacterized protein (DUF4213/DUF364 family)
MNFRTRLQKLALARAGNLRVVDVRIGLVYTAVKLSNGNLGLAYTFRDQLAVGCSVFKSMGLLVGRSAKDLLALFDQQGAVESSLALATANAIFNIPEQEYLEGASIEQLVWQPSDKVAMVGHFQPLVEKIRQKVGELLIFEQQARPEDGILAVGTAPSLLPDCQVALLTSTTIINCSIEDLLPLVSHCREVLMIGPSTPLVKELLSETPITLLSGVLVSNVDQVLQLVSEGAGVPGFKTYTKKVNLALTGNH